MLALLTILAPTALAMPASGLQWNFNSPMPRSFYVTSEVQPAGLYVLDTKLPARVTAWRLTGVFTCEPKLKVRDAWRMDCLISDVAVVAATLAGERGAATDGLAEIDALLTGATASMELTPDGTMGSIELRVDRSKPGSQAATQMVRRALVGFEQALPSGGYASTGSWDQYESAMATAGGASEPGRVGLVNRVVDFDSNVATLLTEGRAVLPSLEPGATLYETAVNATSEFDTRYGHLKSRHWSWVGTPIQDADAPGSAAMAAYVQRGKLRVLLGRDTAPVGESAEVAGPGREPGDLAPWPAIEEPQP